jgi:hypothetical protein
MTDGASSRRANHNNERGTMPTGLKFLAVFGALSASMAVVSAVQAAPPDFCRNYATAAVRQVEVAKSTPACNRGIGARWTTEYRVHFEWCLGAAPGAVEAERNARTNWIRSCRGR